MKITVNLTEVQAEASYLQLQKSIPKLTKAELEAGAKESGIPPLCQANLDERLFMLGLTVMIRELTNPGDTIASAIAKAADLTTVHGFLQALEKERVVIGKRIQELHEKCSAGPASTIAVPGEIDLRFDELRKVIGDDAFHWRMNHERLSGLEIAMIALSKAMDEDPKKSEPPKPTKKKRNTQ